MTEGRLLLPMTKKKLGCCRLPEEYTATMFGHEISLFVVHLALGLLSRLALNVNKAAYFFLDELLFLRN
jgi:hypothetical protein